MKTGILVYSQTGNTRSVAEKLRDELAAAGHEVEVAEVVPEGEVHPGKKGVIYREKPDPAPYECIVMAAPVQAFSLSVGLRAYLEQLEPDSLAGKKVLGFVTKQLPGKWTGGNRAISQMSRICAEKGAGLSAGEIIVWTGKNRDQRIEQAVSKLVES